MPHHFPHEGIISAFLPPPPGVPESTTGDGRDTVVVLAIAGLVLGGAVLIAWLLKPRVARHYASRDTNGEPEANNESASPLWHDAWSQSSAPPQPHATAETELADDHEEQEALAAEPTRQPVVETLEAAGDVLVEPTSESTVDEAIAADDERDDVVEPIVDDVAEITETVQSLLDFANAGEIRQGFSLYSESAMERFRADLGLSAEEFDAAFAEVPAPPPDQQAKLDAVSVIDRLPDGRISALVTYRNGQASPQPERYIFVQGTDRRWLIDDIETVEDAAA